MSSEDESSSSSSERELSNKEEGKEEEEDEDDDEENRVDDRVEDKEKALSVSKTSFYSLRNTVSTDITDVDVFLKLVETRKPLLCCFFSEETKEYLNQWFLFSALLSHKNKGWLFCHIHDEIRQPIAILFPMDQDKFGQDYFITLLIAEDVHNIARLVHDDSRWNMLEIEASLETFIQHHQGKEHICYQETCKNCLKQRIMLDYKSQIEKLTLELQEIRLKNEQLSRQLEDVQPNVQQSNDKLVPQKNTYSHISKLSLEQKSVDENGDDYDKSISIQRWQLTLTYFCKVIEPKYHSLCFRSLMVGYALQRNEKAFLHLFPEAYTWFILVHGIFLANDDSDHSVNKSLRKFLQTEIYPRLDDSELTYLALIMQVFNKLSNERIHPIGPTKWNEWITTATTILPLSTRNHILAGIWLWVIVNNLKEFTSHHPNLTTNITNYFKAELVDLNIIINDPKYYKLHTKPKNNKTKNKNKNKNKNNQNKNNQKQELLELVNDVRLFIIKNGLSSVLNSV